MLKRNNCPSLRVAKERDKDRELRNRAQQQNTFILLENAIQSTTIHFLRARSPRRNRKEGLEENILYFVSNKHKMTHRLLRRGD